MNDATEARVEIRGEPDIVASRQAGREIARRLGLGTADQTRLATAISELTRNVVHYAKTGWCHIEGAATGDGVRIRVVVEDHGPGIPDIAAAMCDGFSTGGGLGAGLPGTRRLMDEMDVRSQPGHTVVTIAMNRRPR
jgi:serine/threonine-protein kinase RsbT